MRGASERVGLVVLLLLFFSTAVLATSYTVCPTSCTYTTISDAVNAAGDGDSILVSAGSYSESAQLFVTSALSFTFTGGVTVNCPGCAGANWLYLTSNTAIDGVLTLPDAGIIVDSATLTQPGSISISNANPGFSLLGTAIWDQTGSVNVTQLNQVSTATGIQLAAGTSWTQSGSVTVTVTDSTSSSYGVYFNNGGSWTQNAQATISITESGGGVYFAASATWNQNYQATISVVSTSVASTGVDLSAGGTWNQGGDLQLNVDGSTAKGIVCGGSASGWTSTGAVNNNATNGASAGDCTPAGSATATPSPVAPSPSKSSYPSYSPTPSPSPSSSMSPPVSTTPIPSPSSIPSRSPTASPTTSPTVSPSRSPTPSPSRSPTASPSVSSSATPTASPSFIPSPSSSPVYLVSNTTEVAAVPVLQFNLTGPDIILLPKDSQGTVQSQAAVGVSLGQVKEVSSDSSVVQSGSVVSGQWKQVPDTELGSSSSYLFTSDLEVFDANGNATGNNNGSLELQFYLFESNTNISLGDLAFNVLPSFAKFSIRLFSWPWASTSDTIEVRMKLNPTFTNFTRQANTPQTGVTTFILEGQHSADQNTKTELHLVDTIELDGQQVNAGGIQFDLDTATSELVLHFSYFNSSLVYDPDLGVLLGSSGRSGAGSSGSDNMPLIVAVSVAVPVAVVVVVTVAVAAVIITHRKRKARVRRLTSSMQRYQL